MKPLQAGGTPAVPAADRTVGDQASPVVVALVLLAALGATIARLAADSPLSASEALVVNQAKLPLGELGRALRSGGPPPAFHAALHGWMSVFGSGDRAVRLLPALLASAALPLVHLAGRRLLGGRVGLLAAVVMALSPYLAGAGAWVGPAPLVVVFVTTGCLLVPAALERPTVPLLIGVAALTAGLLWTHGSAILLVVAVAVPLVIRGIASPPARRSSLRVLAAMALGCAAFGAWVPTLVHQVRAGTPWGTTLRPATVLVTSLVEFSGGLGALLLVVLLLVPLGAFGRTLDERRIELDLRIRGRSGALFGLLVATLGLVAIADLVSRTTFVAGDAALYFPFLVLLVALGLDRFSGAAARSAVLSVFAAAALVGLVDVWNVGPTQAAEVAHAVDERSADGVVLVCPEALGPAVARALGGRAEVLGWPDLTAPDLVDWADHAGRARRADPSAVAAEVVRRAGARPVFLAMGSETPGTGRACGTLLDALRGLRSGPQLVRAEPRSFREPIDLFVFEPRP